MYWQKNFEEDEDCNYIGAIFRKRNHSEFVLSIFLFFRFIVIFSSGQYLVANSAYALSDTCIPLFKVVNIQRNSKFNYCVAKIRARKKKLRWYFERIMYFTSKNAPSLGEWHEYVTSYWVCSILCHPLQWLSILENEWYGTFHEKERELRTIWVNYSTSSNTMQQGENIKFL